ncbi:transposase [Sphingosinicella terrae]|uniref:transposase n=1 Tax=Sphingosinicella terrae TaxID=2172047 RepID=UPI00254704B3|nr:transposase [Sphingosinicella terrae]
MPRLIEAETDETIELAELIEQLETAGFDGRDEDGFAAFGPALRKLANNRTFLADLMIEELKRSCAGQVRDNQYSAQVIMLHMSARKYFIRANVWPALGDSVIRHSGTDPFFYGVPHDHNFSFLTVGYFGPGYWSDYYEYEYGEVVGYPGESVNLRFVEKSRLEPGKVMLYRAHRDVHLQLPADALSVSLNILEASHSSVFRDQYRFDVERGQVEGILTRTSLEPMLALAAHYGGEDGMDLIAEFAARHPSDRIRWCALRARAAAARDLDGRIAAFEAAARGDSRLVAAMARREAARLEALRGWIETAPTPALQPAA